MFQTCIERRMMCFDSYEDRGYKEFDPRSKIITGAVLVVPCTHNYRNLHLKRFHVIFLILFRIMRCDFEMIPNRIEMCN